MFEQDGFHIIVVTSVLPLGRFLASMFFILSCFLPFSLILHMTISKTHLAYPIVSFTMIFLLSSDPLLPPLANLGRGSWIRRALDQRSRRALRKYPLASITTLREINDPTSRTKSKVQYGSRSRAKYRLCQAGTP